MKGKVVGFIAIISLCSVSPSLSELDLSKPLTLRDCISIALERSAEIRNAKADLSLQELRVKGSWSEYLPQLSISGNYGFSERVGIGLGKDNYALSLSGSYLIWDHGRREITLSQERLGYSSAMSRFESIKQKLIFDVIQAYYTFLKARKLLEVDEELLRQTRANTEKVRAMKEMGYAIEADIAAAEVREASQELALAGDRNALEISRANLLNLMGLDPGIPIEVSEDPDYERYMEEGVFAVEEMPLEKAISIALANRAELKEMKDSIAGLERGVMLAKLQRWPRINAMYSYNLDIGSYLREGGSYANFRRWSVMIAMSFPFFDGGDAKRQVQQAQILLQKARESEAELERDVALQVRQAYLNLKQAEKALDISNKQVRNARLNLEVTRGKYEQQLAILIELLEAQALYSQALTNQVKAFYDYKIAKYAFQKAIGMLRWD